ncbi:hypothetical protein FB558_8573 [Pseudonocardia kunmingensis]|uniref:Lipoprotein n=2 Tax=Pseudonocardia kunmingensis TaxID=630975 RepID=A0A543CX50_9PSEU|nr:hypothetical protein FB558_8573 [Pseudonocardia kunmingensis]
MHDRPTRQPRRGRAATTAAPALILLAVLGFLAGCAVGPSDAEPDRTDPEATATSFVRLYAAHDPAACQLLSPQLVPQLQKDGRCSGERTGELPEVEVIQSRTCGVRHGFDAAVNPPGEIGEPYVAVTLELVADTWSVRAVRPITDRSVIRPTQCEAPATEYGG